jgi:hypothetical protein
MKKMYFVLAIIVLLSLSSCADVGINQTGCLTGHVYGFWGGLWHGIIAPFSFFGSLIWDDISMYAVNNNGGWYDFGFVLGVGGLGFSSNRKSK